MSYDRDFCRGRANDLSRAKKLVNDVAAAGARGKRNRRSFVWIVGLVASALVISGAIFCWRVTTRYQTFQQLRVLGGTVMTQENCPKWLRVVLGDDLASCLQTVSYLRVSATSVGIAVEHLDMFQDVHVLAIDDSDLRQQDVAQLYDLKEVRLLDIDEATDATLADVGKLDRLETLEIVDGSNVTDASLSHIAQLVNLKTLVLAKAPITDAGLAMLAPLKSLKSLR